MLTNKDILDEKCKILRQVSKEVEFPLTKEDKKNIDLMIEYLTNSQIDKLAKKYDLSQARAVATAAFRKASNTNEIFTRLKQEFQIDFKVIDAKIEAKISVLGMKRGLLNLGLNLDCGYCDLGGASCEFSFRDNFQSFDFGIISFYEKCKIID